MKSSDKNEKNFRASTVVLIYVMLVLTAFVIVGLLGSTNGFLRMSPSDEDKLFINHMIKFHSGKLQFSQYKSFGAYKKSFLENYYKVSRHNERFEKGLVPYKMELNAFSHLNYKTAIKHFTGLNKIQSTNSTALVPKIPFDPSKFPKTELPQNFSWTEKQGIVRDVQNQGSCGSCYIFATVGSIEGQLKLKFGYDTKLSEQEVLDCVQYNGELLGCAGGFHVAVYDLAYQQNGVTSSKVYPYQGRENACKPNELSGRDSMVKSYVELPHDEEMIKRVLYTQGPLYVSFFVSPSFLLYRNGIYTDASKECNGSPSNHAVLLTGWGTENGTDYWQLKNSWGTVFGENGYFRLLRGQNLCNIADDANYPNL